ncbi:hypothetical protein FEE95_00010 [Maribacter algarum]|uniref:Uncharacterized protein n=1 Tax=Maribacter algarum (ex Zhang et al. 2020) TaxID=2578118 RepID=A0A5S3PSD0_9FLAO|nr:hypothetical protein [Maribacter algarum]TMM57853.1 hypothetical protein FEE95_00010 [Maribacter algarum]
MVIYSCSNNERIFGKYEAKNFTRTIDTLILKEDYSYEHLVYEIKKGESVKVDIGNWEIKGDKLYLIHFMTNHDEIELENGDEYLFLDEYLTIEGLFEKKFVIWKDMNFYYQKI